MSKTTAPLLSFDARGQLGQTLVYSSWKGRAYARRYVVPANPQTAEQTKTRSVFSGLNAIWRFMPATAQAAWNLYADNSRITARNAWLKANVRALRGSADLTPITLSPAAGSGLTAQGIEVTPTVGGATIAVVEPTLPAGWTIVAAHALAIAQQDPHGATTAEIVSGSDTTTPYSIALTGLTTGTTYVIGAWFEYAKADGSKAYGAAQQTTVTPT